MKKQELENKSEFCLDLKRVGFGERFSELTFGGLEKRKNRFFSRSRACLGGGILNRVRIDEESKMD